MPFLGEKPLHTGEGLHGGILCVSRAAPARGRLALWVGLRMTRTRTERLTLLPCALALSVPRRASEDLGVAGHPTVRDGDHDVVLQTPQG